MDILISNDDGYYAPGIQALMTELSNISSKITMVAPDKNRSAASSSLTLERPIRVKEISDNIFAIDGTPTDSVHLALTGLLEREPDIVVSGINAGSNLGDDVIYSGTVAAAIEGRFLGFPALAISLVGHEEKNYPTAAIVCRLIIEQLKLRPLPIDTILNINVPDVPQSQLKGLRVTRLGSRHKAESVIKDLDPRGKAIYWIGPPGGQQDAGPGTDFHAVNEGYVSVTPIHVDLTQHQVINQMESWLQGLKI